MKRRSIHWRPGMYPSDPAHQTRQCVAALPSRLACRRSISCEEAASPCPRTASRSASTPIPLSSNPEPFLLSNPPLSRMQYMGSSHPIPPKHNVLARKVAVRLCKAEKETGSGSTCSTETKKRLEVWEAHTRGVLAPPSDKLGRRIIHNVDAQAVPDSTFSARPAAASLV